MLVLPRRARADTAAAAQAAAAAAQAAAATSSSSSTTTAGNDTARRHELARQLLLVDLQVLLRPHDGLLRALPRHGPLQKLLRLGNLGAALANGAIIGSTAGGKLNTASRADLAHAAANVLTSDGHAGEIYELGNDQPYTLAELAAELSHQTGKPIVYTDLPKSEYAKILEGVGLPAPVADLLADSDAKAASGALADDSGALGRLLGRPTQTLEQAVALALK